MKKSPLNLAVVLSQLEKRKNFFAQLVVRLVKKNPKFFKWLQLAAGIVGFASLVLDELKKSGAQLPPWTEALSSSLVSIGSILTIVIAQLPNQDPPKA